MDRVAVALSVNDVSNGARFPDNAKAFRNAFIAH